MLDRIQSFIPRAGKNIKSFAAVTAIAVAATTNIKCTLDSSGTLDSTATQPDAGEDATLDAVGGTGGEAGVDAGTGGTSGAGGTSGTGGSAGVAGAAGADAGMGGMAGADGGAGAAGADAGMGGMAGIDGGAGTGGGAGTSGTGGLAGSAGMGGMAGVDGGAGTAGTDAGMGGAAGDAGCIPSPEVCNAQDDNCDGIIDNLPVGGAMCVNAIYRAGHSDTASYLVDEGLVSITPDPPVCIAATTDRIAHEVQDNDTIALFGTCIGTDTQQLQVVLTNIDPARLEVTFANTILPECSVSLSVDPPSKDSIFAVSANPTLVTPDPGPFPAPNISAVLLGESSACVRPQIYFIKILP